MTNVAAVIPARMNSSRFPGKPLATIVGRPMIEHVFRRSAMCSLVDAVYIATPDDEIYRAATSFGAKAIMTSPAHERASDRVAEVSQRLDADIIVMIQGDEPMITPGMITDAVTPMLADRSIGCVNLVHRISTSYEYLDANTIKVVKDTNDDAVYFSRAPIPARAFDDEGPPLVFKQVCVIPFRREFLERFTQLPPTPLETIESIDMLRALEHGLSVRLVETHVSSHAVDTPDDLKLVEDLMRDDPLISRYDDEKSLS